MALYMYVLNQCRKIGLDIKGETELSTQVCFVCGRKITDYE